MIGGYQGFAVAEMNSTAGLKWSCEAGGSPNEARLQQTHSTSN